MYKRQNYTNELIGFGLRIANGINLDRIPSSFSSLVNNSIKISQKKWGEHFIFEKNKLKLSEEGFAFSDAIAIDLMI